MDRKFLEAILHKFSGGQVGLENVAAAIGESTDTIEDVIEPYLIQQGFLQRTPRGRRKHANQLSALWLAAGKRITKRPFENFQTAFYIIDLNFLASGSIFLTIVSIAEAAA